MKIKVSVLIPVYNTQKYLRKCLESVLNQTLRDIEIIITNDGSTDNSYLIIQEFAKKDNRIKVIYQENQGLGATRNSGIELASGKYIAFLDSDDWVEPDCYEVMYNEAEKNKADLVVTDYFIDSLDRQTIVNHLPYTREEYLINTLNRNVAGFSWNKLYRRELIIKNNLRFPLRGELENIEDQYFSIRTIEKAQVITFTHKSLIHYIIRNESIVNQYQETLIEDGIELFRSTSKFFNMGKRLNQLKLALEVGLLKNICQVLSNEVKIDNPASFKDRMRKIKGIIDILEYRECLENFKRNGKRYSKDLSMETRISLTLLNKKQYLLLYFFKYIRISLIYIRQKKY